VTVLQTWLTLAPLLLLFVFGLGGLVHWMVTTRCQRRPQPLPVSPTDGRRQAFQVQLHTEDPGPIGWLHSVGDRREILLESQTVLGPVRQVEPIEWHGLPAEPTHATFWKDDVLVLRSRRLHTRGRLWADGAQFILDNVTVKPEAT
jgi:hypothetical protein